MIGWGRNGFPHPSANHFDFHRIEKSKTAHHARMSQKANRRKRGSRLSGKSSSKVAATSSPPRLHYASLSREALLVRRTLITSSPQMLRSATRAKIEKKIPNMRAGLSPSNSRIIHVPSPLGIKRTRYGRLNDLRNLIGKIGTEDRQKPNSNSFGQSDRDFLIGVSGIHREIDWSPHCLPMSCFSLRKFPVDVYGPAFDLV
jgi:hypothetical protein